MGGPRQRGPSRSLKDLKREINARGGCGEGGGRTRPGHAPAEVVDSNGVPYTTGQMQSEPWTPSPYTALKVLLSARLGAAVWSGISDCDETFNYWEPAHHLLYGQGLQTWEYEPRFALRSYLYILVHAVPGWLYARLLQPNPMLVFYFLRCLLGLVCALCEVYFYRGVLCEFGANVGRLCLGLLVTSAGMFVASSAFLPSTTSLYLTLLSVGAWFHQRYKLAIFFTALSTFLSWPFAALIGLPVAIDIVIIKRKWRLFVDWSVISAITILVPQVLCDSYYYGKPVLASLNIVLYNVFTNHGPDLYGTEPASFYLINGILNFNIAFPLALLVLPVQILSRVLLKSELSSSSGIFLSDSLSQSPLYLWLLVFWTRPHKEERFLFPVYPLICLAAAMVIDSCQKVSYFLFVKVKSRHFLQHTAWLGGAALILSASLSCSRVLALYQGYHGATDVWMRVNQLPEFSTPTTVCVGKEWFRYPSSFFLPSTNFKLAFLKSEFAGQLPKYFSKPEPESNLLSTQISSTDFNDMNREEPSRYISHAGKCHFLVDLDNNAVTENQPSYVNHANWTVEADFEFLDPSASNPVFRAFYVPLLSSRYTRYNRYLLLRRVSPRRISPSED